MVASVTILTTGGGGGGGTPTTTCKPILANENFRYNTLPLSVSSTHTARTLLRFTVHSNALTTVAAIMGLRVLTESDQ